MKNCPASYNSRGRHYVSHAQASSGLANIENVRLLFSSIATIEALGVDASALYARIGG
jgi:predicted metal-dependent HD superfamily phosphohydrolase